MTPTLRARAAGLARLIELLVFPSFCRLCREPLERPPRCGRFLHGGSEDHPCARCLDRAPRYARHRSCGAYGGTLKDVILLFKYRRCAPLSRPLAAFAEACLGGDEALWRGADALVPVPLHPSRRRERGFNQARLLARGLAAGRGLAVLDGALIKTRNAPAQAGLRAADRERNVRRAYAVKRPDLVRGRVLVLVDDVTTTGATLRECAGVLMDAGAKEVRAVTLAQA